MKTLLALLLLTSINIAYSQTCQNDAVSNTPNSRYTNNNNGTITDKTTKLVWKQCSEGQTINNNHNGCTGTASTMTWQEALTLAASTTFAGNSNWQLPNIKQLASIVSNHCTSPCINTTHFPNTPSEDFWSSSPYANGSSYAWTVYFDYGHDYYSYRNFGNRVRLVRPMP